MEAPPARIARNENVRQAGRSVLKIRGENDCGRGVEGTGFLYQPGRIMTNAHVVAGVDNPHVMVDGEEVDAKVVEYDPRQDIAVLAVDGLDLPYLRFDYTGESKQAAAVLGYPEDGPYDVQGARIRTQQRLRSPDIYGGGTVIRDVYSLRSLIRPGNSGGPLVSTSGEVLGMIFAASVTDKETGYALTARPAARSSAAEVDTGVCLSTSRQRSTGLGPPSRASHRARLAETRSATSAQQRLLGLLGLLDGALRRADVLHPRVADEAEQRGDRGVDDPHDQEAPGEVEPGQVDEVGEGDRQHDHDEQQHEDRRCEQPRGEAAVLDAEGELGLREVDLVPDQLRRRRRAQT